MANRTVLFQNSAGALEGVSQTADSILVSSIKRPSAGTLAIDPVGGTVNVLGYLNVGYSLSVGGTTRITSNGRVVTAASITEPAILIGSYAGDPGTLANGDIWYNSTTNKFRARENGASADLISAGTASGWTDDGTVVRLTTSTDDVAIGGATSLGKLTIYGDTAAEITQVIRTVAAQTADVLLVENSAGTDQVRLTINNEFIPAADNQGSVGTNGNRWALIRGTVVTSGDLNLENDDGSAAWTIREMPDFLLAINRNTGKKFRIALEPIDG